MGAEAVAGAESMKIPMRVRTAVYHHMPILHERIVSGRESYRGECVERVWECKEFVWERVRESVSVSVCERVWECVRVSARESESVRVCERVIERWECVREFECVWDLRSIRGCTTCGIRETNYHGAQLIVPPRFMPKLFVKELRSWELLRARARQEERRTASWWIHERQPVVQSEVDHSPCT